jgi:hypothetical protein
VPGTGHDSIVVEEQPSARAVELIAGFVDAAMTGAGSDVDTTAEPAADSTAELTTTLTTAATTTDRLPVRTV